MKSPFLLAATLAIATLSTVDIAGAQCSFEHPRTGGKLTTALVQVFIPCGGTCIGGTADGFDCTSDAACSGGVCRAIVNGTVVAPAVPNTTTKGGIPSCAPPQTPNQAAGNPSDGWRLDESQASGTAIIQARKNHLTLPEDLNGPNTADVAITLKLKGVTDGMGLVNGSGKFNPVLRFTSNDEVSGDLTVVDYPTLLDFTLTSGAVTLKTTANALLNEIDQPSLPKCTSVGVVSLSVLDGNGTQFLGTGVYLP